MASQPDNIEPAIRPDLGDCDEPSLKQQVADEGYELFDEANPEAFSEAEATAVRRKLDRYLLPLMCAMYGLNYVDKVAMGWAVLFDFREDLSLHGTQYSWASSMFYFGYLVAQYPANYILQRYKTARVISISTICWGVLMLGHLGLKNFAGLMVIRFLLGIAESVITPGFVMYTSMFYTRQEQVLRTMLWACMQGIFSIAASLLSYGLGHITNTILRPWMYIFLILGILSILVGSAWLALMPQTPSTARFLTDRQQIIAVQRVASNMMGIKNYQWKPYQMYHAVKDPKTWLILAFVTFTMLPNGGLTSFGSLVIEGLGFDRFRTLLIAVAGIATVYGTMNTDANRYGRVVAYWLINSYAVTWPFLLTIIGQNISGHTKRATTNAMMLIIFAAGNIAGPFLFRSQDAPHYILAIASILVFFCAAFICALALRYYMIWENKRRDRVYGALENMDDKMDGMRLGMHDKTDLENPDFRYVL